MIHQHPSSAGSVQSTRSPAGLCFPAFRLLFCLLGSLAVTAVRLPAGPLEGDFFEKGYILVNFANYGVYNNGTNAPATTAGLQRAINDARTTNHVVYLPSGTYLINNTLKAWVQTREEPNFINNNIVIVGATTGTRPIIRLAANASGFGNTANPKVMLEFRNFDKNFPMPSTYDPALEKPSAGYGQMLRNVTLDCNAGGGNGNAGAVGLYFNHAQDSSIENVKVDATDALCGIWGIPARAWGAVNIEVVGGQYGINTTPWPGIPENNGAGNIGSVIAGAKLTGQTENAIRHPGQALTVVGFEIVTPANSTKPAVTVGGSSLTDNAQAGCLNLIDGKITLASGFAGNAAVFNPFDRSIYLRNVSVTGSNNLVKTGERATVTGTGPSWKRIDEYSFCNQGSVADVGRLTYDIINGNVTRKPGPPLVPTGRSNGEVVVVTSSAPPPPADLLDRHIWASLPSVDDNDYYDPVLEKDFAPGLVSSDAFQAVIEANRKIFLRPGVYKLDKKITLKSDTILFGAARHLTSIDVNIAADWGTAQTERTIVTTESEPSATTYLGDLGIGMPAHDRRYDVFNAIDWRAGANSMLHIARPYHTQRRQSEFPTQDHSIIKISGAGGGRLYFLGRGEGHFMQHNNFRILEVRNTTSPMWIYGLNMEHAQSDIFAEFVSTANIRIYCVKTEFAGETPRSGEIYPHSMFLSFTHAQNVGLFGYSAIRHAPSENFNIVEVKGSSGKMLASLVVPQENTAVGVPGDLLHEAITGESQVRHVYPNGVALYKRGTITAGDEETMKHAHIGYAPLPAEWTKTTVGTPGVPGSAYYGSGTYTINASGANVFFNSDEFYFVHQQRSGNHTITARVATQENTEPTAKAGVMFRVGTGRSARFVNVQVRPSGTAFHYRSAEGGTVTAAAIDTGVAPYYVRLKRVGNTFTGSVSVDKVNWNSATPVTITGLPTTMEVGLFNCSVNDTVLNTSTFDDVSITSP